MDPNRHSERTRAALEDAWQRRQAGEPPEAAKIAREALDAEESAEARLVLALALLDQDEPAEAAEILEAGGRGLLGHVDRCGQRGREADAKTL